MSLVAGLCSFLAMLAYQRWLCDVSFRAVLACGSIAVAGQTVSADCMCRCHRDLLFTAVLPFHLSHRRCCCTTRVLPQPCFAHTIPLASVLAICDHALTSLCVHTQW